MFVFRNLGDQLHEDLTPHIHWQVEYWEERWAPCCPSGLAWCLIHENGQFIEYVLVCDEQRRTGVATRLINACRERWPNIVLLGAISEGGAALLKHLNLPPGTVVD